MKKRLWRVIFDLQIPGIRGFPHIYKNKIPRTLAGAISAALESRGYAGNAKWGAYVFKVTPISDSQED